MTKDWRTPINIAQRDAAEAAVAAEVDSWDACGKSSEPQDEIVPARPKMLDIKGYDKVAAREKLWRTQGPGELRRLVPYMKSAGVLPEIVLHAETVLLDMEREVLAKYGVK